MKITRTRIAAALGALFLTSGSAFADDPAPAPATKPAAAPVSQGEYLARAGDCVACHSVPGGAAFAGGLRMGSPVGNIYSTNITPDKTYGIGDYTLADFDNALRHGIAKDGHRLYPAMPYPSYAKLTDADVKALYDWFMHEVPPAHVPNKPNEIRWIMSPRWPMAFWDTMFVTDGAFKPDPNHDAQWNRGAYLVEGLEHCGACHTPRGLAFQEKALDASDSDFLSGASLDAWSAANLRGDLRTGLGSWSKDDVVSFLKTGHNRFGSAFGSMIDVINNSAPYLSDSDIEAMAVFLKSLPAKTEQQPHVYDAATTATVKGVHDNDPGATVYAGRCQTCHGTDGKGAGSFMPPIAGNPTVMDNDPESLINLILNGSEPLVVKGTPDPYRMPQFRVTLTDKQIADVVNFIRTGWGNGASTVTEDQVAAMRKSTDPTSDNVIILKMR